MVDRIATAKVYKAGQDAMLASDFRAAKTSFLWASSLEPENVLFIHAAAGAACRLGQYREAEGLYRKAIGLAERTTGVGQPQVALVAYSLVELYENQGRVDEAWQLSERVVRELDREQAIHANSQSLGRLAALCHKALGPEAAEVLYRDALAWRRQVYGPDHAKVADCEAGLKDFLQTGAAHRETSLT
jgi:tetratricopeptide (TPR) repeat protein